MHTDPHHPADDARLAFAIAAALLAAALTTRALRAEVAPPPPAFQRYLVDVNTAPAAEIEALPGVGATLAQRIVAERSRAPFATIDDLRRVPGVGPATLERLRGFVRCGGG